MKSNRQRSTRSRIAPYVRTGLRLARSVYSLYRRNRRRVTSGNGVTTQNDRSRQYRYKPLNRRTRRKVVKRYRKFVKMLDSNLATQTVIRNSIASGTVLGTGQGYFACHLYGLAGVNTAAETGVDDLYQIFLNDLGAADRGTYLQFTNAVLDLTLVNTGLTTTEVDVYEYSLKKNQVEAFNNMSQMVADAEADTGPIGTGTSFTMLTRGVTPFEFPILCKKMKILKKTKYLMSPGQGVTYQMKDRRDIRFNSELVLDYTPGAGSAKFNHKDVTGVFVVTKAITGSSDHTIQIGATRSYRYVKKQLAKVQDVNI